MTDTKVRQLHLRLTPDLLQAVENIASKIEATPSSNVLLTRRMGRVSDSSIVRYALFRCLAELGG